MARVLYIKKTNNDDGSITEEIVTSEEVMKAYREYDGNSVIEEWDDDDRLVFVRLGSGITYTRA